MSCNVNEFGSIRWLQISSAICCNSREPLNANDINEILNAFRLWPLTRRRIVSRQIITLLSLLANALGLQSNSHLHLLQSSKKKRRRSSVLSRSAASVGERRVLVVESLKRRLYHYSARTPIYKNKNKQSIVIEWQSTRSNTNRMDARHKMPTTIALLTNTIVGNNWIVRLHATSTQQQQPQKKTNQSAFRCE